jgi:hypothetical protein
MSAFELAGILTCAKVNVVMKTANNIPNMRIIEV